jgi:hypothetical protein
MLTPTASAAEALQANARLATYINNVLWSNMEKFYLWIPYTLLLKFCLRMRILEVNKTYQKSTKGQF